mgnify:CR=1 FL=1
MGAVMSLFALCAQVTRCVFNCVCANECTYEDGLTQKRTGPCLRMLLSSTYVCMDDAFD